MGWQNWGAQLASAGWDDNLQDGERLPLFAFLATDSSWLLPCECWKELSAVSNEGRFVPASTGKANSFAEAIQPQGNPENKRHPGLLLVRKMKGFVEKVHGMRPVLAAVDFCG